MMKSVLLFLCLLLPWAANAQGVAPITSATSVAGGSTTALSFGARFGQRLNVRDGCGSPGAVGNGVADDSPAFAACMNLAVTMATAGTPVVVYVPGGNYLIQSTQLPLMTYGVGIVGDAPHKTYITIGSSYAGTLFGWSDAWQLNAYNGTTLVPSADKAGPFVENVTVIGNTTSASEQDAFVFYGRDDFVEFHNVAVYFLNGQCIRTGYTTGAQTQAYVRESLFDNFWCWEGGTASKPAVEISTTSPSGSDATNQVTFVDLNIFASAGIGLQIHTPTAFSNTRQITFIRPRVEHSAADNIQISALGDLGGTNEIHMFALESTTPGGTNAGFYALNIGVEPTIQDYDVQVFGGTIGPCSATPCYGVYFNTVRQAEIKLQNISTTGANITYGVGAGANITLDGGGSEQSWTYTINSVANKVATPLYKYGDPTGIFGGTTPPAVAGVYHDGSAGFGNPPSGGAVDLQFTRNANTQIAGSINSCLIAGTFNTITAPANDACIAGGATNMLTGVAGFIGGGAFAIDRGRYSVQPFASGKLSVQGDAEIVRAIFRCTTNTGTACRLTADQAAAGVANCDNILVNFAYGLAVHLHARDNTTPGTDYDWQLPNGFMTRETLASTTEVTLGTPNVLTRGTTTGATVSLTADTTNACINLAFTPPTGNTDTWNVVAKIETVEVQ